MFFVVINNAVFHRKPPTTTKTLGRVRATVHLVILELGRRPVREVVSSLQVVAGIVG